MSGCAEKALGWCLGQHKPTAVVADAFVPATVRSASSAPLNGAPAPGRGLAAAPWAGAMRRQCPEDCPRALPVGRGY